MNRIELSHDTHRLESQEQTLSASWNCSKHYCHSLSDEQEQASLAGHNCSKTPQPLTNWRTKRRHHEHTKIATRQHSHSHPGESNDRHHQQAIIQRGSTHSPTTEETTSIVRLDIKVRVRTRSHNLKVEEIKHNQS